MASSRSPPSSSSRTCTIHLLVGNTYHRLPKNQAPFDRSGTIRKVHDWTLYVDVIDSSGRDDSKHASDLIESVSFDLGSSFDPSRFLCHSPIPVKNSTNDGTKVMRFCTRQQTYGGVTATIKIRGTGGATRVVEYPIVLNNGPDNLPTVVNFTESTNHHLLRPLKSPKMPTQVKFGIELELTSATSLTLETIATALSNRRTGTVQVIQSHRQGREQTDCWKLVPDGSIFCSVSQPDCNTFELVSPILQGGDGLNRVSSILQSLNSSFGNQIKLNKSMGFHVHIDVSQYNVPQLVKICQNFIKYEDVMDTFMPLSRRTGSAESNRYFCSNKSSVGGEMWSNRQRHTSLGSCDNLESLADIMNHGNSRYYKLNLQNLVTGRQPTLEFRQHSATANYEKTSSWIRFCTALVVNSAKLAPPTPFAPRSSIEHQLDALFLYVIKDRALANFYRGRRGNLKQEEEDDDGQEEHCCSGCARGRGCSRRRIKY